MSDEYCAVSIKDGREIEAVETTSSGIAIERTSQGHSTTRAEDVEGLSAEDKKLLKELEGEESKKSGPKDKNQLAKIQKVPTMLRETNAQQYFKPRAMVIGPLHRGTSMIEPGKTLKVKLATKFIKASGKTGERLLQEIKNNINKLKERFDENVIDQSCSDETLARMLFLDGCSILQFISSVITNELKDFEVNNDAQATLIQQDLFLLENQIPFQVLVLLMELSNRKGELMSCVHFFVYMNTMAPASNLLTDVRNIFFSEHGQCPLFRQKQLVHLLDLLRSWVLFEVDGHDDKDDNNNQFLASLIDPRRLAHPIRRFVVQILHGLGGPCGGGQVNHLLQSACLSLYKRSFRNVQELKAAGIKFKPSNSRGLRAISFNTQFLTTGQLKLPPLIVDDSTVRKLWNLVAFEMCPDNSSTYFGVTSYISFLDSLIDTEQDVKGLRSANIIWNRLSSDAEVADLFNTIGSNLVPDEAYFLVKNKIQRYYERRFSTWMAQAHREHLRNPWTILALLATITLLLLTAIQAWYSVFPKN